MNQNFILRADDLGYSRGINYAIADCVQAGLIQNVGVMANMPHAQHGINLIKEKDICLGLHGCISAGRPVSSPERIPSLVTKDGDFHPSSYYRSAGMDPVVLEEVCLELENQVEKFRELTGWLPVYIDAHAIQSQNFEKALELTAKKYGILYVPFVLRQKMPLQNSTLYIDMNTDQGPDSLTFIKNLAAQDLEDAAIVVIFHPGYLDLDLVSSSSLTTRRMQETAMLTGDEAAAWFQENQIRILRFSSI